MYGMNAAATNYDGENKYIRITDIDESTRLFNPNPLCSPKGNLESKYLLNEGDVLFTRTGASVGKSYLYNKNDGNVFFAGFLIRFNIKNNNPYFIFSQTLTYEYEKWVLSMSMRSGQPGINAEEYKSLPIHITTIEEQNKIANFLFLLDSRIECSMKTIQNLESLMNGVRAKIFNDNDLFLGNKKLQEIGTFFSGGTPLTSNKNYYEGTIPFIKSGEINSQSTEQFISLEGLKNSSAKLVEKGDVLIALYGATSGEVGVSKISGAINQAILCIRTEYNPVFIVNYLKFKKEEILKTFLQGGQGNLSADIIKSISIPIPEGEKQKLIVQLFSNLEKKLEIETQILGKLNLQKKFFLQNLFV